MNTRHLLRTLVAAMFALVASAFAQTTQTQATVARVIGTATVTLPDGSTTALTQGMKVAQGATITTGADGDVYLESHAGYVTAIKGDSVVAVEEISVTTENGQVKQETTLLALKSGDLVAKLDPKKKAVNNYQVRTPKGVAAARGTVFTVQYRGGTYAIAVVNGVVTVIPPAGASTGRLLYTSSGWVAAGMQVAAGQATMAAGKNAYSTPEAFNTLERQAGFRMNELLALAVATVAVAAQNNIGGTTTAEAAAVASAVFAAVPGVAEQAGALISKATQGQNTSAVVNAIKAVTPAAALAAFDSGVSTGTFTPSTTTTSTSNPADTTTTAPIKIDAATISRSN